MTECPHCESPTPQKELSSNSGVCKSCKEKFEENYEKHLRAQKEKEDEDSWKIEHAPDSCAFVDGHMEPAVDFPYHLFDEIPKADLQSELKRYSDMAVARYEAELLRVGGRNKNQFFLAANTRAFAKHVHPNQNLSGEFIANKIGMTKAAFFRRVNQWRDIKDLPHVAGSWKKEARKSIQRATKKSHEKRKHIASHKPKSVTTLVDRLGAAHTSAGS